MADSSKVFRLAEGMSVVNVGEAIMGYLSSDHKMYAEGTTTPEGYFLQAKSQDSGWKKLAGMSKATQVQIIASGDLITVSIGSGEWSDKVGAGVVGAIVFAPLMFTAAFGAWEQKKLVEQIFTFVQNYIASGGKNVVVTATPVDHGDAVECPSCKAKNTPDKKFCGECGAPLAAKCPSCGASVPFGTKFCGECGSPMVVKKVCAGCGAELSEGTKFCGECGKPVA
jgi:hypothetical protein